MLQTHIHKKKIAPSPLTGDGRQSSALLNNKKQKKTISLSLSPCLSLGISEKKETEPYALRQHARSDADGSRYQCKGYA